MDLTIGSPGFRLAMVSDNYVPGASDRNDRNGLNENRLGFRDTDTSDGSVFIPSTAHIDISSATNNQRH